MRIVLASLILGYYAFPATTIEFPEYHPKLSFRVREPEQESWIRQAPTPESILREEDFNGILPLSYLLQIRAPIPNRSAQGTGLTFEGSLKFRFRATRSTDLLYLHSSYLHYPSNLEDVSLSENSDRISISQTLQAPERELLIFKLSAPLRSHNEYELSFPQFQGNVRAGFQMGVFQGFVHQSPTQSLYVIATQFQLESARTAFPCVDVPNFKSNLSLTIVHPPNTVALGNMDPVQTQGADQGWTLTRFRPTPHLPTYTMGFVILPSAYIRINDRSNQGIDLRLYYNPYRITSPLAQKLMEYAVYSLNFYEKEFAQSLPLNKIDLVILPQFAVQGMENFGLITLNQDYLIKTQPAFRLSLIVHELVHQWISNLVTVKGWDHICLQEGVTDHFARNVVKRYFQGNPEWDRYHLEKYLTAMKTETDHAPPQSLLVSSQPKIQHVSNRCFGKAVFLFDSFENLVGPRVFQDRVRQFLRENRDSTVRLEDFARYFDSVYINNRYSAADFVKFWYLHGGYPSIFVSRDYGSQSVRLSQQHIYPKSSTYATTGELWPVPVKVSLQTESQWSSPVELMTDQHFMINSVPVNETQWLLLNREFVHFYRVNYDLHNWNLISEQLKRSPKTLPLITRAQLINDFCFFSRLRLISGGEMIRQNFLDAVYTHPAAFPNSHVYIANCG